ncbi:MAG: hypothetical protein LBH72_07550 [Proteiniphilum sp.]|jgi:hypothetical protein|nr:hypothetical protein [Proteiniphilum sp.]
MKKIPLLACCLFLSGAALLAQQLDGTYKNGTDSIAFSNQKVIFRISGFGGLSSAQAGEGTYELAGDYLFIHASDYTGHKTSFELLDASQKDTCTVRAINPQHYAIQGILVESRSKSGKLLDSKVTGSDGKVFFTPGSKINTLSASSLGYDPVLISHTPGKDYRIKFAENDIIENRTVVLKIGFIDEETVSLLMLADDYDNGKDRERELQKLEKKAQRINKLDKRYKKVYIPRHRRN